METYLTISLSNLVCGDNIKAHSFEEAISKCPQGFKVVGKLICEIDAPEFDGWNLN